jgi:predicted nucleotidyltransferase component of viral defense system
MLQVDALRSDTRELFLTLQEMGGFEDFVLIGGTAMALHYAHRESEDLDFVYVPTDPAADRSKLPQALINALVQRLRGRGHPVLSLLDVSMMEEAENEGFYLPNSHQDWAINGVKLTFFVGDTADRRRPFHTLDTVTNGGLRILTADAIFETKSRLIVQRATSRDLFDLWYFIDRAGKTVEEVVNFALQERPHYIEDYVLARLQLAKPSVSDPLFKPIVKGAPADYPSLISALRMIVDEYQQRVALAVFHEEPTYRP